MSSIQIENEQFVHESLAKRQEMMDEEHVSQIEASATRAWLESELNERSRTVEIYGREFQFRPIGTTTVSDVVERASVLDDGEDISAMPKLFKEITEILGKHCLDPDMDAIAFGQIPPDDIQEIFEDVSVSDIDEDRVEKFRS